MTSKTMKYPEALEVARSNPGYVVRRCKDGQFEVCASPGKLRRTSEKALTEAYDRIATLKDQLASQQAEVASLKEKLSDNREKLISLARRKDEEFKAMESRHSESVAAHKETTRNLRDFYEPQNPTTEEEDLLNQYQELRNTNIETAQEVRAEKRRNERTRYKCTCNGMTENCDRCLGSSYYLTDGFGNIVAQ